MAAEDREKHRCAICRAILTDENTWRLPETLGGGHIPYCTNCMQKVYSWLASVVGYKLAMYFAALMFNMPYLPDLLAEAKEIGKGKGAWNGYMIALRKHEYDKKNGKFTGFADGVTELKKAFGGDLATLEVDDEMLSDEEYLNGHKAQVEMWGYGPDDAPYTSTEYDVLDENYAALTVGRPYRSEQTDLAIKKICRWTLEQSRLFNLGSFDEAKKIQDMIRSEMENEQLRKKDELPSDIVRIDDIALAIERAGLHINDYDELCEELASHVFHPTYPYTRDAADQMLLLIRNATAWNEGVAEVASLPAEFAVVDTLREFAEKPDETEEKIYNDLQISQLHMEGN